MKIDPTEDVQTGIRDLTDESWQYYAPLQVRDAWLATLEGTPDASYITRMDAEPSGTRWVVLAVKGRELVVIEGTSEKSEWSREDEDTAAEMWTHILGARDVKRLRLLEARDASGRMGGRFYDMRSRWAVDLEDGRTFTVPSSRSLQSNWERAEEFIAALRQMMAD